MPRKSPANATRSIFGRERELAKVAALLRAAGDARASCVVRIVGDSGVGKSALLDAALAHAASPGWVVLTVRCYAGQQRSPGAALRRLAANAVAAIGETHRRSLSGLESDLTARTVSLARVRLAFVRLVEGLLVDGGCIVAVDDAQWADMETLATLRTALEDLSAAPLVVIMPYQSGYEPAELPAAAVGTVMLDRLGAEPASSLVRRIWPDVAGDVGASIVERAGGVPFDLVALARQARANGATTPADVATTARTLLAEGILALHADHRTFLQVCSLMPDPVDLRVVRRFVGDDAVLDALITRSARYLESGSGTVRFRHALIADAARGTISSPLALRRRILGAYLEGGFAQGTDFDRIAALAADLGDTDTEYRALIALASDAFAQEAYESAVAAFERALRLRRPDDAEFVTVFNQYTIALRMLARWPEAQRVLESVVADGIVRRIPSTGLLAAALLFVVFMQRDREAARTLYEELRASIAPDCDRHAMLSMGAYLASEAGDAAEFDAIARESNGLEQHPSRYAVTMIHIAAAILACRVGDFTRAAEAMDVARAHVDNRHSVHRFSVDCYGNLIRVKQLGCTGASVQLQWLERREDGTLTVQAPPQMVMLYAMVLSVVVDFAAGNWSAAMSKIESAALAQAEPSPARAQLLSVVAAIAALTGETPDLANVIEAELRHCAERGLSRRALPLAFWWAAFVHERSPRRAAAIVEPLLHVLADAVDSTTIYLPIGSVLYAARAKDERLVRAVTASLREEPAPWDGAQRLLALGAAYDALRDRRAAATLAQAERAFEPLSATFFAAYAAELAGTANRAQRELLDALRVRGAARRGVRRAPVERRTQPTMREREIAGLVVEGLTNRGIAERLTLSERTVEVHLANLFDKLDVTSRTQLVRYVLETGLDAGRGVGARPAQTVEA